MAPTGSGEITPRDLQVVRWIACGMERDDVAKTLNTSRSAVNRHMTKVMKLTATPSGTAAVAHVMALGLLRAEDVTSLTKPERRKRALMLAPDVTRREHLTDAGLTRADVAAWLRSRISLAQDMSLSGELEEMAQEIESGNARLPIPGPRRDPDAPRPPQQPAPEERFCLAGLVATDDAAPEPCVVNGHHRLHQTAGGQTWRDPDAPRIPEQPKAENSVCGVEDRCGPCAVTGPHRAHVNGYGIFWVNDAFEGLPALADHLGVGPWEGLEKKGQSQS